MDLTNEILDYLDKRGISKDEILAYAEADEGETHRFVKNYIVSTADSLVLIKQEDFTGVYILGGGKEREEKKRKDTKHFKNNKRIRENKSKVTEETYTINEIEDLIILRRLSGGALAAKTKDGEELLLKFTKSKMSNMHDFVKAFRKIKSGESVTVDRKDKKKFESCPKCGKIYPNKERKICPSCIEKKSIFFRCLYYFKPHTKKMIFMMFCYIASAGISLVWPYLNGTILYDKVLKKDPQFLSLFPARFQNFFIVLAALTITMLICKIIGQLLGIIQGVMSAKIVPDVVQQIKSDVFKSMGRLSINFYNSRQTGGLMTRVLSDADEVTGFFIDGVPYFFINLLTLLLTVIVMFSMNPLLAVCSLALLPFLMFLSAYMLPKLWRLYGRRHRENRSLSAQLNDNFMGARVVKAFGQERKEIDRFTKYNQMVMQSELQVNGYDNRFYAWYSAVENIASFLTWGVGAFLVLGNKNMELGTLITFTSYVSQLNGPLDFFSHCFRWWSNSMNSAERILEIIDAVPEIEESSSPVIINDFKGNVEFNQVTFGYEPNQPVLKNISFNIKSGQMLGIVGRSGAGKSTLANLLNRLYDPQEGSIYIDGIDLKSLSLKQLRNNVAMVSQETYIFMGTVAENIAYARKDAKRAEIIAATIKASAHDFICKMPDGYETVIGSSGRMLSGGEKQRISIARAILANPKILILDEATAAVDTETEQAIQYSIEELIRGRTTISIAHRLSTLNGADKLIVMENGEIKESGTHKELIAEKGIYYRLMQIQNNALALEGRREDMKGQKKEDGFLDVFDEEAYEQEFKKRMDLLFLKPEEAVFKKTKGGFLSLDYQDVHYDRVDLVRTFPFSDPYGFISVRESNEAAKEIGVIKDISLFKEEEGILKEQLEFRYHIPKIQKILSIKEEYGYAYFEVKTDYGDCRFAISIGRGSVISLSETKLLIIDLDGNRFEIPDIGTLSAAELKKIDLFL
ncbi:ABC transporter transmembrane domain-containing protein [Clostridium sp. Marseille-P299]|uniref:ABC transporter transmembrane domain-containing protein n=1 Tax=Clostridium sp. Marseille-P299 TaxID=1805477 RepID=UPI0008356840|nr:DUF1854 domain-containing protein [Clostridium sp. Marseille-P299]